MPEPGVQLTDFSLRPMTPDDREMVREWRNREHVRRFMFYSDIVPAAEHTAWFSDTLACDDKDYQVVHYRGRPVGLANAVAIDTAERCCEWGFYIADADAPKGSGTCMGTLMLDHIFETHDVDTVLAEVLEYNTASSKLHERLGFRRDPDNDRVHETDREQFAVFAYRLTRSDWQDRIRAQAS